MAKKKNPRKDTSKQIESIRHKDKRANIPTEELRDFVADEELTPRTMLYPRDPSLDPQLVWKGKDEQDREDLAVPVVPIYIQEKIHPQAIIDALPRIERTDDGQANLFADFNGLEDDFEKKVDFYSQKDDRQKPWSNRLILGDSLLVMTSLAEKEGLKGKVQAIYLDPPYGIKFGSNWQVSTRKRDVKDGRAEDATRQPEQVRAFRDTWKLGVHSYLSYLRDRLVVARDLLTETGSIFVQIGDENVHRVRVLMDEVFGSENFVSQIVFQKSGGRSSEGVDGVYDLLLWYAKDRASHKFRKLWNRRTERQLETAYGYIHFEDGSYRLINKSEKNNPSTIPDKARRFRPNRVDSQTGGPSSRFTFNFEGRDISPPATGGWRTTEAGFSRLARASRLMHRGESAQYRLCDEDNPVNQLANIWTDTTYITFGSDKTYVVETNPKVIGRCLLMTTDPGDLVLDPTCGSGTTAYVAEQWGRRWITCDTSRVALALARTRLMSAKYPWCFRH